MIDRALVALDLQRLAGLIAPLIEARLEFLRQISWRVLGREIPIGAILLDRLTGSPAAMTSDALSHLLDLPDAELAALVDAVGRELGAWRGMAEPLGLEDVDALRPVLDHLTETM